MRVGEAGPRKWLKKAYWLPADAAAEQPLAQRLADLERALQAGRQDGGPMYQPLTERSARNFMDAVLGYLGYHMCGRRSAESLQLIAIPGDLAEYFAFRVERKSAENRNRTGYLTMSQNARHLRNALCHLPAHAGGRHQTTHWLPCAWHRDAWISLLQFRR